MSEHEAGRETDALVAEKVMGMEVVRDWCVGLWPDGGGWDVPDFPDGTNDDGEGKRCGPSSWIRERHPVYLTRYENEYVERNVVPCYSTDIAAAWLVVEKLAKDGEQVSIRIQPTQDWGDEDKPCDPEKLWSVVSNISGTDMCWSRGSAPTAPLAICRAALAVVHA